MEEHWLNSPRGAYRAVGFRAFDMKTRQWSVWWLDGRYPALPKDASRGHFENGVGRFYDDRYRVFHNDHYVLDGKPMLGRLMWSNITPSSARWEQASSADSGKTWQPNWIAELQRVSATPALPAKESSQAPQSAGARAGAQGFDFLRGDWQVHHRYLRVKGAQREWIDAEGTCRNRALLGGAANVEEHLFKVPSGAYRSLGVRAYDAKTGQWSIWWLDGRDPFCAARSADDWRFRERHRHVLRAAAHRRQADSRAVHVVADHASVCPLGTSVFP